MKREFSTSWKSSKRPGKQRKYLAKAPLHLRGRFLNVNLAKPLRKENGRAIQVVKNDTVKVMRGKFKGKNGKVLSVDLKRRLVEVECMQAKKMDGSKVNIRMQPSNLQIITMEPRKKRNSPIKVESKPNKEEKKNAS